MSVTIKDNTVWSVDYAVETYNQLKELEGYVLWKAKLEFDIIAFRNFCKDIGAPPLDFFSDLSNDLNS